MAPSIKIATIILNITELVLTVITVAVIHDLACIVGASGTIHEYQFVTAVVHGHLSLNVVVLAMQFTLHSLKLRILISGSSAILWLCCGSMIVYDVVSGICGDGTWFNRGIGVALLSFLSVVVYVAETILHIKSLRQVHSIPNEP